MRAPIFSFQGSTIEAALLAIMTGGNNTVLKADAGGNSSSFLVGQLANPAVPECIQEASITGNFGMELWVKDVFELKLGGRLVALGNTAPLGFYAAKAACETAGGHLPMIKTQQDYQDVMGM